ncbi:MAG: phenylacetate--CoA ligase [Lachnospiraceae bacterium]|jgi:phenylacetate-CoA ligase|nr:phenylacetate--CoA ligase [Lachnospiraceae bacterium]
MSESKYWEEEWETAPREVIEEKQLESLKHILQHAYDNTVYYKKSFDEAGVKPSDVTSIKDIAKFPFIDKQTERLTQGKGSMVGELCAVDEKDIIFISASSGSTGVPTISPFTQKDFDEWMNIESRLMYQAGMRPTDRYMHGINFSLFVGGPCVLGAQRLGAMGIWSGTLPSDRLLYIIQQFNPTFIQTTPSYALYLGETAKKKGIDPKKLSVKTIIVAGEPGGSIPATRKAIEELWDAKLIEFYGLSDIFGACAAMCEEQDGLHLAEDHILVETVDVKTGEVLPDGETGELVFTSLRKHARPMIRFRTGDIGYVTKGKCKCGRTSCRINIVGRKDDMFIVSGVNIFPSDVETVLRDLDGITGEYRIHVFNRDYTARYGVEVERSYKDEEDHVLDSRVVGALKSRIGVKPDYVKILNDGDLPRAEHKAKRLIDERK